MKRIMQKSILLTLLLSVSVSDLKAESRYNKWLASFKEAVASIVRPSGSGLSKLNQFLKDFFHPVYSGAARVKNAVADGTTKGYTMVTQAVGNHNYALSGTLGVACYLPAKHGAKMFCDASRLHKLIAAVVGLAGCGCACKVSGMSCENINPKAVASFLVGLLGAAGLDQYQGQLQTLFARIRP